MGLPKDPRKIRERIRSYERELRCEKKEYGGYDNGAGKRYLLGPLYLLMGDFQGAIKSFRWFEKEFPDDGGESGHQATNPSAETNPNRRRRICPKTDGQQVKGHGCRQDVVVTLGPRPRP